MSLELVLECQEKDEFHCSTNSFGQMKGRRMPMKKSKRLEQQQPSTPKGGIKV